MKGVVAVDVDIGLVAREDAPEALAAANRVIDRSLASGALQRWSMETGTTWIAPVDPQVGRAIGLPDLMAD